MIRKINDSILELTHVRKLVLCGLFTALYVILTIFTIKISDTLQPSLNFAALLVCAYICGPVPASLVGIAGDLIGWFLSPGRGAFFPGFTLTACLLGFTYGLFFYKEKTGVLRALFAALTSNIVFTFCLTGLWLYIMYGMKLDALLLGRLIRVGVTFPVEFLLMLFLLPQIGRLVNRSKHTEY